jgi:hypothetical protein
MTPIIRKILQGLSDADAQFTKSGTEKGQIAADSVRASRADVESWAQAVKLAASVGG